MSEADRDGEPAPHGEPDNWTEVDIDAAFAAIVSRYGQSGPQIGPWPVAEDGEPAGFPGTGLLGDDPSIPARSEENADRTAQPQSTGGVPASDDGPGNGQNGSHATTEPDRWPSHQHREPDEPVPNTSVWERYFEEFDRSVDPDEDNDDRYVPPDPPPLPRGDFLTTLAWVGVFGGPLLLLVAAVAWHDMPAELILAGVAAFIGGFVLLVARMPSEHPDDPDDGAVV